MDVLSIIIIVAFGIPLLKGVFRKYTLEDLEYEFMNTLRIVVFGGSMVIGFSLCKKIILYNYNNIFSQYIYDFIGKYIKFLEDKPIFIYLFAAPILAIIIYTILFKLISLVVGSFITPLLSGVQKLIDRGGKVIQRIAGVIFSIPKALFFPLIICFGIYIASITWSNDTLDRLVFESPIQKEVTDRVIMPIMNSRMANRLPVMVNESLKIDIEKVEDVFTENINIYYNGVTLKEGIQSNNSIVKLTQSICESSKSNRDKGYIIYRWIVDNVVYDQEKAANILDDDFEGNSGAIVAFNEKKGVCFDLACLYAAMAIEEEIPVRIIAGKGYNGEEWIEHSWNQIYLEEDKKWIKVDPTFGLSDDYYDNFGFDIDHKDGRIIGEF